MLDGLDMILLFTAAFVIGITTGFLLKRKEKPYPVLLLTIHKLILFGAGVGFVFFVFPKIRGVQIGHLPWVIFISTIVSLVIMVVSGGLVSIEKQMPPFIQYIHKVFPYISIILALVTLFTVRAL